MIVVCVVLTFIAAQEVLAHITHCIAVHTRRSHVHAARITLRGMYVMTAAYYVGQSLDNTFLLTEPWTAVVPSSTKAMISGAGAALVDAQYMHASVYILAWLTRRWHSLVVRMLALDLLMCLRAFLGD